MKILQILPQLESGGVETGTMDLAKELVQRGHQAVVISAGGQLVGCLESIGAKHYTLDVHKKSLLSILYLIPKVIDIINKEQIDIIHARSRVPGWIGFLAAKYSKAIFITTCHGYYKKHFLSRVMGWGKFVIVISQIIGQHMIDDFKVSKEKIRLIYRGVDLEKFTFRNFFVKKNSKKKTIGIIARISPLKGHVHFLKSLPGVLSEFPNLEVLIIGEAPAHRRAYLKELFELAQKPYLKGKVKFLGRVQDIPAVLKKLDLLVLTTTTQEAFGRVIIEAGAVGVPVVATRVGGVVEIIEHGKDGLLVEPADPHGLSGAILKLLKDENLAANFAQNLKQKVEEKFSLKILVEKTIAVYKGAINAKRIVVFKFGALGDVILITPALKALRRQFPRAYIEVMIKDECKGILQTCPDIDDLIVLKSRGVIEILKKILKLRKAEVDFSIDLQNNKLSHLIGFGAGIRKRFGYKNKKFGFLLNLGIPDNVQTLIP